MTIGRIVVAVDGSANSLAAVRWTADLATALGSEVIAVHALGLLEQLGGTEGSGPSHRADIATRFATTWCEPLILAGVATRHVVRDGPPVPAVLGVAEEEGADLIVVGSRGLGTYPEQLLGSTSSQVAQSSRCPVAIIPLG